MRLGGGACRFVGMCYCKTEPSSGAWERVQCRMKLIRVILFFIFFSKLCNLSICAFSFGKAMDRNIGFEIFWCCGSDGNNLLLKVGTR